MKNIILLLSITVTLISCSPNSPSSPVGVWDVHCDEYKVITATNDTTKLDGDTYYNTSHTPEFYEDWYGIKPTPTGYLFYGCEIK